MAQQSILGMNLKVKLLKAWLGKITPAAKLKVKFLKTERFKTASGSWGVKFMKTNTQIPNLWSCSPR